MQVHHDHCLNGMHRDLLQSHILICKLITEVFHFTRLCHFNTTLQNMTIVNPSQLSWSRIAHERVSANMHNMIHNTSILHFKLTEVFADWLVSLFLTLTCSYNLKHIRAWHMTTVNPSQLSQSRRACERVSANMHNIICNTSILHFKVTEVFADWIISLFLTLTCSYNLKDISMTNNIPLFC